MNHGSPTPVSSAPQLALVGHVEYLVTGVGAPTTVFVHGLAGSIEQTRPFGSGVTGTKVFPHLRGHGGTAVPRGRDGTPQVGTYADLAGDVDDVLRATGATRALGVSLGAGALARLMSDPPREAPALDRVVLCLPPPLDAAASAARSGAGDAGRFEPLAAALEAGDPQAVALALRGQQPKSVRARPAVTVWARRRAFELLAGDVGALVAVLRGFSAQDVAAGPTTFADVATPVLVIAQQDDDLHLVEHAQQWVAALPTARLEVLEAGGVLWSSRDRLRDLVSSFFNE